MNRPMSDPGLENNPLTRVRKGMVVYGRDGDRVGIVDGVYLGEVSPESAKYGRGSAGRSEMPFTQDEGLFEAIQDAFSTEDELDDTVRYRLQRSGFIRVEGAGLFAADRYIPPERIASVSGDRVQLKVN